MEHMGQQVLEYRRTSSLKSVRERNRVSSAFPSYDLKHYGCLYTVLSMFPLIKLAKFSILAHIRQCTTYAIDMKNY